MKRNLHLIVLLCVLTSVSAQYPRASLWTSTMANFAAIDAAGGVQKDAVLFVGSSTFTMWNSLPTDFPNSKILNRAFGGSMMTDLIYFFGQVVAPYSPRQVVLYEGDNDLNETAKTAEAFMDDVIAMTRMINIYYPGAKILLVSIKPSPSRTATFPKYEAANLLMKTYAGKFDYIDFVDTWTPMLKSDGSPETSYFGSDMLHMNATGYALWKTILEPYLLTSNQTEPEDKIIFAESSHANYHDYSWESVTAPSIFNTVKSGKIATDSTYFHQGATSLKLSYQGKSGGDWKACVAGPDWIPFDMTSGYAIEMWVYAPNAVASADLPAVYLESVSGTTTAKLNLSVYLDGIPAEAWQKVRIPVEDFKAVSASFPYNDVKTVFFSQLNINDELIAFNIDDIKVLASSEDPGESSGGVFVDFGPSSSATPGNWNNVYDHQAADIELIDDGGNNTGIKLQITDPFYNGYNTSGATTLTGDAADFPTTSTMDNFFGHENAWGSTLANPAGVIRLSGLNPAEYYSFTIFSSRAGATDVRETKHTFEGAGESVFSLLNSSGNTSEVAVTKDVLPTSEGIITITVSAGPNNNQAEKFYYLGAMKIMPSENPSAVNVPVAPTMQAYYTDGSLRINDYTGTVQLYDLTGKAAGKGQMQSGYLPVSLEKGAYIVATESGNSKLIVKE